MNSIFYDFYDVIWQAMQAGKTNQDATESMTSEAHARKRTALLTTVFTKYGLNSRANSVFTHSRL